MLSLWYSAPPRLAGIGVALRWSVVGGRSCCLPGCLAAGQIVLFFLLYLCDFLLLILFSIETSFFDVVKYF